MPRTLGQLFPGTIVALEYKGKLEDWIVTNDINEHRVILLRSVLVGAKRMHSSNVAVYDGCEMDVYLTDETNGYLSGFDESTRACFVPTDIQTYSYGDETPSAISRRCFVPSEDNLFGNNAVETEKWWIRALMEYTNTDTPNTARIGRDATGSAQYWWLRSPSSATQFRLVYSSGSVNGNASNSFYLRPALSVAAATIVSDVGADVIRLLPDPSKTYREVSCKGIAGEMADRPKSVRVIVGANNLYDVSVEVSNNAGDPEPVWVNAIGGEVVELDNAKKTTENWKIGVKLYGKSETVGWFTEPVILVEEER